MKNVAIFGDSVSKGVIYDSDLKRYRFAKGIDWQNIEQRLNIKIENHSKMGATITYGYHKLLKFLETNPNVDTILLEYGGNDCDYNWEEVAQSASKDYQPNTTIETFRNTLVKMIKLIESYHIKPIVLTLPSIHAQKYYKWIARKNINMENVLYFLGDIEHIYRHHELYNMTILEVAIQCRVEHIDIRKVFLTDGNPDAYICEDGIHPTIMAEQKIVEHIIEQVNGRYRKQIISLPKITKPALNLYQKEYIG
ncbi:SGNH/GDSL hydrolase family protein [Mycoplasmatota bacterium]|nr:SGNH/GDSL hydrolase family protein [Mycoplasmatota bacterium]